MTVLSVWEHYRHLSLSLVGYRPHNSCVTCLVSWWAAGCLSPDRLVGLVDKVSALRAEDPGFESPNQFKSVENNQHTEYCHSYRQHPEDCQKRSQWAAWRQWPQTCNPDPCQASNHQCRKTASQLELQERSWKCFRELTDIYTKSITFSKHSVNKKASNFNSAVLRSAKECSKRQMAWL